MKAMPRVGLFGLLGSGNSGNDASMETVLGYLREAHPGVVVDALCGGPERVRANYGIDATPLYWYQRFEQRATGVPAAALKLAGKGIDAFPGAAWPQPGQPARLTARAHPLKSPHMALRDIIVLPDKRLRETSEPVTAVDAELRALVEDMFETMYEAPGIGLAAIQIGEPKRVVTMDLAKKDEPKQPQVFINPELLGSSDEKNIHEEGCLSIPEFYEEIERPAQVRIRYLDLDGKQHEVEANGLLATCTQHEIEHLDQVIVISAVVQKHQVNLLYQRDQLPDRLLENVMSGVEREVA